MTNKETKYAEKLMKFIIGEEVKVKRTKGEKVKLKELGVGHLSADKSQSVKLGEREYASGTISKIEKDSAWNVPPAEGREGAWPLTPNPRDTGKEKLNLEPNKHHANILIKVANELKKAKTLPQGLEIFKILKSDLQEWIEVFEGNLEITDIEDSGRLQSFP